jgi:5-methylcytosine-specific restriction enzyme A
LDGLETARALGTGHLGELGRAGELARSALVGQHMTRSLDLWVGKTDDAAIPPRVRLRVFEKFGGVCQISKRKIRAGEPWQLDHIVALCNGGRHAEDNLQPVLAKPHKEKTASDVALKSKVARTREKHLGIKASKHRWPKRSFGQARGWS